MFNSAINFNQNLSLWDVSSVIDMTNIFVSSNLSLNNYDALLYGWTSLPFLQNNVYFGVGTTKYTNQTAHDILTDTYGWIITDGGNNDTINPLISITYPANNSVSNDYGLNVNYTYSDNIAIDECWWSDDFGITNVSNPSCENLSGSWVLGINTIWVWVNDTSGNEDRDDITFIIDNIAPYFTFIPFNQTFTFPNSNISLNFTATDNIEFANFSINWTDYFSINNTGYLTNTSHLPAGTYLILVSINDSIGNQNTTLFNITINKNTNSCLGLYNSSSIIVYTNSSKFYSDCDSIFTLKLNGSTISNSSEFILGGGLWNISSERTDNSNYTNIFNWSLLKVNPATSVIYTYLNSSRANLSILNGTSIWLNSTNFTGNGTMKLFINKTLNNTGNSNLSNFTKFINLGTFNITSVFEVNQNWTESYETWFLEVNTSTRYYSFSIWIPGSSVNSASFPTSISLNDTADSCWVTKDLGITNSTMISSNNINWSSTISNLIDGASYTLNYYCNNSIGDLSTTSKTFLVSLTGSGYSSSSGGGGSSSGGIVTAILNQTSNQTIIIGNETNLSLIDTPEKIEKGINIWAYIFIFVIISIIIMFIVWLFERGKK
jgi:hypothetical protein